MKRLKLVFREISNYFFIHRTLRNEIYKPSSSWYDFKLRRNWYGRIYTVISLREEDMGEEEIVRNWKAMEMMRPINDYLSSLGLQELIFPSIEAIPDTRSYLVVYSPIFIFFTYKWVFTRLVYLSLIGFSIYMLMQW
jgi:hypothetical protein